MAFSKKKLLAAFDFPFRVEVRAAEFRPLGLIRHLDLKKLRRGSHRIEIGFSEGRCCRNPVYALIRNGMVTGIEVEHCKESKKVESKQIWALVSRAYKELGRGPGKKWKPVPVEQFLASPESAARIVISWGNWCIQVCWTNGNLMTCVQCCAWPPNCRIDTIFIGDL